MHFDLRMKLVEACQALRETYWTWGNKGGGQIKSWKSMPIETFLKMYVRFL